MKYTSSADDVLQRLSSVSSKTFQSFSYLKSIANTLSQHTVHADQNHRRPDTETISSFNLTNDHHNHRSVKLIDTGPG